MSSPINSHFPAGAWRVLIESGITYADRALLLIGPGMAFEVIVEGVVVAIEILHLIVLFEAANDRPYLNHQRIWRPAGWGEP